MHMHLYISNLNATFKKCVADNQQGKSVDRGLQVMAGDPVAAVAEEERAPQLTTEYLGRPFTKHAQSS